MDPKKVIASFDSASVLHAATVAALAHRDFPHLGAPAAYGQAIRVASTLPWPILKQIYSRIGGAEGLDPRSLPTVDMREVAASFADAYAARRYPAVMIGSSNGAMTQLAAAAQLPWLPGTLLVPVHHVGDAQRADLALQFGREVGPSLVKNNPNIVIHQMHDAAQDELMVARMAYFRTKWTALPEAYERFLSTRLTPHAPVLLIDDESTWPVTRVSDRHVFQVGGRGGLAPEQYLARPHSPAPDDTSAEAEWGSDPNFSQAVREWGTRNGHPVITIHVDGPQEAAHPVATLLREWISDRGGAADRLIVPSFVLGDAWRTVRSARVPFWTFFPVQSALESLRHHLANSDPYREADILVFQHGAQSPGLASPADFATLVRDFGADPHLLALHPSKSPHDIGTLGRYGSVLKTEPDAPIPFTALPVDLAISKLGSIVGERGRTLVASPPADGTASDPLVRATEWLNSTLAPILGQADVAPDDGDDQPPASMQLCPICGRPMAEHATEHSGEHTFYHHPDDETTNLMEGN